MRACVKTGHARVCVYADAHLYLLAQEWVRVLAGHVEDGGMMGRESEREGEGGRERERKRV